MKPLISSASFAAALLLAGCTVGPDYHLPPEAAVNIPAARGAFAGAQNNRTVVQDAPPANWWRLYRAPKLSMLVTQAFAANTDLRVADANLEQSRALLAEARAAGRPNLTFNFAPGFSQLSAEQYLFPGTLTPFGLYDVGLTLSYQLDLFGRIRRGVEAASADDEAVEAARDLVRVNVAAEVTRAYLDACGAGGELVVARHTLALQQQSLALTQQLFKAGRGASLDVTRSEGQLEQFRANIPTLLTRQRNAEFRLATLTGRPPEEFDGSLDDCDAPPVLLQPVPVGNGAQLLARRPDVRAAERRLAAATATIGVRTAALYPDITLGASIGSTGSIDTAFSQATNRYGLGPAVTWELDHTAARARIEQANAQAKADLARFDGTMLNALREVESELNVYRHDRDRDASLRIARERAGQAYADAQKLERAGRTTSLTTLDAERTLAAADASLAASQSQLAADQIGLFLALGGGWETDTVPKE